METIIMQGDVALRKTNVAPKGEKGEKVDNRVLAWGETSGHAHVVQGDAEVFRMSDGRMSVATGKDGATLDHMDYETKSRADHNPIIFEPNSHYEVRLQNEYNPFARVMERVID